MLAKLFASMVLGNAVEIAWENYYVTGISREQGTDTPATTWIITVVHVRGPGASELYYDDRTGNFKVTKSHRE